MTMAAEIKNRMGPAPAHPGTSNVKINSSTPVKPGGGGCCQQLIKDIGLQATWFELPNTPTENDNKNSRFICLSKFQIIQTFSLGRGMSGSSMIEMLMVTAILHLDKMVRHILDRELQNVPPSY